MPKGRKTLSILIEFFFVFNMFLSQNLIVLCRKIFIKNC